MAIICRILTATKLSDLKKETDRFMTKEESKNFINRAKELSSDDEMVTMFNQENMHEMIRNTELKETAIDIAKNMIKIGLTNEQIVETTKLSIAEVEN